MDKHARTLLVIIAEAALEKRLVADSQSGGTCRKFSLPQYSHAATSSLALASNGPPQRRQVAGPPGFTGSPAARTDIRRRVTKTRRLTRKKTAIAMTRKTKKVPP